MKQKAQRGPVLPSVVMVMLATMATGLLAVIGFQALPDTVIPSTFGGSGHESRNVNVSDSPDPGVPAQTANPAAPTAAPSTTHVADPTQTFPSTMVTRTEAPQHTVTQPHTTAPKPVTKTSTPAPTKTTTPAPTKAPSPSPTQTTQAPSAAPSCGTGRKPRCPSPAGEPQASPTRTSGTSYTASSAGTSSSTTTSAKKPKKAHPAKKKHQHLER